METVVRVVTSVDQYWSKVCGRVFDILKLDKYMAVAQWIKCSAGELKDPGLIPSQGEFFSLKFLLKRK